MKMTANILKRLHQDDPMALNDLYQMCYNKVFLPVYRILGRSDEYRQAINDALFVIWEKRAIIETEEHLNAMLYTVLKNKSCDILRARSINRLDSVDPLSIDEPQAATWVENPFLETKKSWFHLALMKMPLQRRKVMEGLFFQGLEIDQVAQELGLSSSTVRSHKQAGIAELKGKLEKMNDPTKMAWGIILLTVLCICIFS